MITNVTMGINVRTGFTKMNYALERIGYKLSARRSNLKEICAASCIPRSWLECVVVVIKLVQETIQNPGIVKKNLPYIYLHKNYM